MSTVQTPRSLSTQFPPKIKPCHASIDCRGLSFQRFTPARNDVTPVDWMLWHKPRWGEMLPCGPVFRCENCKVGDSFLRRCPFLGSFCPFPRNACFCVFFPCGNSGVGTPWCVAQRVARAANSAGNKTNNRERRAMRRAPPTGNMPRFLDNGQSSGTSDQWFCQHADEH